MRRQSSQTRTTAAAANEGPPRQVPRLIFAVRWVIIVGVVLQTQFDRFNGHFARTEILLATIGISIITAVGQYLNETWQWKGLPLAGVAADLVFTSAIVYFSDGVHSPFYPLYYVQIVTAAAILGTSGAVGGALAVSALTVLMESWTYPGITNEATVISDYLKTVPYLFVLGVVASQLSNQARVLAAGAARMKAEREAASRDMELASRIQKAQLPLNAPRIEGLDVAVFYQAAREVGGDIYIFHPVEDTRLGIAIGDASGKGVSAALLSASARLGLIESFSSDMASMMCGVNRRVLADSTAETFITMLYAIIDMEDRSMRFVNAGHMPPIILRPAAGETILLEDCDLALGVLEEVAYREQSVELQAGDVVVFYTDGVTDALGLEGAGIPDLRDLISGLKEAKIQEWPDKVSALQADALRQDDMTLVAIKLTL